MRFMSRTACLIKPDAHPLHTADVLKWLLEREFVIALAGELRFDQLMVDQFYYTHVGKHYYEHLSEFMQSGVTLAMILWRYDAVPVLRSMMGPAAISLRQPGEIRFHFGDPIDTARNCIHGSDSDEAAVYETALLKDYLTGGGGVEL